VVANDDEGQRKMAAKAARRFFAAVPARRALQLGEANPSFGGSIFAFVPTAQRLSPPVRESSADVFDYIAR
jgi:hypothetical protein